MVYTELNDFNVYNLPAFQNSTLYRNFSPYLFLCTLEALKSCLIAFFF